MNTSALDTEKLLRQVLSNIAQLPPDDLLVVYETINDLKQKGAGKSSLLADEIRLRPEFDL